MPKENKETKSKKIPSKMVKNPLAQISPEIKKVKEEVVLGTPKLSKSKFFKVAVSIFAVLVIGALFYQYKSLFVVAMVNGKPISRIEFIKELEKQGGKQALDSVITRILINQAAENKNITIAQSEIDTEIQKIEENLKSQNLTLESALSLQGLTRTDLIEQIVLQKRLEKILADKTQVTEEEITKYMEDNKSNFPEDSNLDDLKAQVRDFLANQKFSSEVQKWLADIKTSASIKYFVDEFKVGD
ncbi:SurA N-terminal domain-containing protein [Patescibacteria group bacterium]|nr:SurA N-terminal domain-containing protein [Patescibacteria group bacterium]